jgi:hypothetical protein
MNLTMTTMSSSRLAPVPAIPDVADDSVCADVIVATSICRHAVAIGIVASTKTVAVDPPRRATCVHHNFRDRSFIVRRFD